MDRIDFKRWVEEIARLLSMASREETWAIREDYGHYLGLHELGSGMKIGLRNDDRHSYILLSGVYPSFGDNVYLDSALNDMMIKEPFRKLPKKWTPDQAVAAIQHTFIGDYAALFGYCKMRCDRQRWAKEQREDMAGRLAGVMGCTPDRERFRWEKPDYVSTVEGDLYDYAWSVSVDVRTVGKGNLDLENAPEALIEKLLVTIRDWSQH